MNVRAAASPFPAILLLCCAAIPGAGSATAEDVPEGFVPLFNGRDLSGWFGGTDAYEVDDGVLLCKEGGRGKIYTDREYGDFVLRLEFRLTPGANNGIGLRTPIEGDPAFEGMEIQILDDSAETYATLQPYQYHGSVYGVVPADRGHLRPVGEWNEQEVTCIGRRVTVVLNGETVVDADLDEAAPEGRTIDGRDHPGLGRRLGHIALLGHGDRVDFRAIAVKELDGSGR